MPGKGKKHPVAKQSVPKGMKKPYKKKKKK